MIRLEKNYKFKNLQYETRRNKKCTLWHYLHQWIWKYEMCNMKCAICNDEYEMDVFTTVFTTVNIDFLM